MEHTSKDKIIGDLMKEGNAYIKEHNLEAEIKYYDPTVIMYDNETVIILKNNYIIVPIEHLLREKENYYIQHLKRRINDNAKG